MRPPRGMNRRTVVLAILLFAVVIAGMFVFAFVQQRNGDANDANTEEPTDDGAYAGITRIEGKHFFEDGVHTVVGEIPMPTPCDLLESDARVAESMPEQVTLSFSVTNNAEFCPQVITPQRFKQSVTASEQATFRAELEGREVELNLVEAAPGESPDDFELFIKG